MEAKLINVPTLNTKAYAIMTAHDEQGGNVLVRQDLATLSFEKITLEMYPDILDIFKEDAEGRLQVVPAKYVMFANKHDLLIRPAEYSDICGRYMAVFATERYVFSRECFEGWLDAVEENLDMFPAPQDFATEDELKQAYSVDRPVGQEA